VNRGRNSNRAAVMCLRLQCVYELVQHGANVDTANNSGETALHQMTRHNKFECVLGLLAKGASSTVTGVNRENALHMAVEVIASPSFHYSAKLMPSVL